MFDSVQFMLTISIGLGGGSFLCAPCVVFRTAMGFEHTGLRNVLTVKKYFDLFGVFKGSLTFFTSGDITDTVVEVGLFKIKKTSLDLVLSPALAILSACASVQPCALKCVFFVLFLFFFLYFTTIFFHYFVRLLLQFFFCYW